MGTGSTQFPLKQVPAPTRVLPAQVAALQVDVGNAQAPFAVQTPAQAGFAVAQSELVQQLDDGMQAPPHSLNPVAQVEQSPAPLQMVFAGQAVGAGTKQLPLEQVPGPTRVVPTQAAVPQAEVGYAQVRFALQTPAQAVLAPAQSALVQQLADGMHALPHALKPVLQV